MSSLDDSARKVVPAQLNYLAIYSPALSKSEHDRHEQIVYYHARRSHARRNKKAKDAVAEDGARKLEQEEQSRQIGLAQGMLTFARGFSNDAPLEYVDTEKHRIVLTELETDWWILACIDLTRLPSSRQQTSQGPQYEYSSREVSPAVLLKQQLTRAYRAFLLHNSHSLSDLWVRLSREKFCATLEHYWNAFAFSWDVLLHGNPAVDVYGGIKLAAGGELGVGVGEEDWGSGEREVLEGLIASTEGLLDLTVSRFGEPQPKVEVGQEAPQRDHWLGTGSLTNPADGLLFSGIGSLTRPAIRDLSHWAEDIYVFGETTYGVQGSGSDRRKRRRIRPPAATDNDKSAQIGSSTKQRASPPAPSSNQAGPTTEELAADEIYGDKSRTESRPDIPPPIVRNPAMAEKSLQKAPAAPIERSTKTVQDTAQSDYSIATNTLGSPDAWRKVFTLGYGTAWGVSKASTGTANARKDDTITEGGIAPEKARSQTIDLVANTSAAVSHDVDTETLTQQPSDAHFKTAMDDDRGRFIIGLQGNLDSNDQTTGTTEDPSTGRGSETERSDRLSLRTLFLSLNDSSERVSPVESDWDSKSSVTQSIETLRLHGRPKKRARLRVVVYVHRPFLYLLLFEPTCPLLTYPSFFHDLHHHLTPLHASLQRSTAPITVAASLASTLPQPQSSPDGFNHPIHTLVYSPNNTTVRSGIPNIPAPGTAAAEGIIPPTALLLGEAQAWTRVEALSVHSRILDTYSETRTGSDDSNHNVRRGEHERTLKTGRGWWIVWLRVSTTSGSSPLTTPHLSSVHSSQIELGHTQEARGRRDDEYKEAYLIRRSADSSSAGGRKATYRATTVSGTSGGWMQGMSSTALAPFSRWQGATRISSATGTPDETVATSGFSTVGGIGVDARSYVEGLLSLNR